jgi:hypothetical protein
MMRLVYHGMTCTSPKGLVHGEREPGGIYNSEKRKEEKKE